MTSSTVTPHCNTATSPSASSGLYTYTVLPSTNAALPPHPRLQTSYPPSVSSSSAPSPPPLAPGCPSTPPVSSYLTLSGFFNRMLVIFEPGALNCYIFFRSILLTLSVSRNLISTHLPLFSGSLNSLLCDLIAPTGMTLLLTLTLTVLLQRNTCLFPLLLLSSLFWH